MRFFDRGPQSGANIDVISHKKIAQLIPKLPKPGFIWSDGNLIFYECSLGTVAITTLQYDSYPDLDSLASKKRLSGLTMAKSELKTLYRKTSIIAANRVRLSKTKQGVKVFSENTDDGKREQVFEGIIDAKALANFPTIILDVNHLKFLADLYSGNEISLVFGGSEDNVWTRDKDQGMYFLTTPYGAL